jgi:hypothetical protein
MDVKKAAKLVNVHIHTHSLINSQNQIKMTNPANPTNTQIPNRPIALFANYQRNREMKIAYWQTVIRKEE